MTMVAKSRKKAFPIATEIVPLSEFAKLLPGKPHYQVVRRWAVEGVTNPVTKRCVKLATWMLPSGARGTTKDAYQEFIEDLNKDA